LVRRAFKCLGRQEWKQSVGAITAKSVPFVPFPVGVTWMNNSLFYLAQHTTVTPCPHQIHECLHEIALPQQQVASYCVTVFGKMEAPHQNFHQTPVHLKACCFQSVKCSATPNKVCLAVRHNCCFKLQANPFAPVHTLLCCLVYLKIFL